MDANKPELTQRIAQGGRIGIIDIGSNSIRLVVYDHQKRAPVPIYNEKVMCALGKGLSNTGVLNPDGLELARDALRRFLAMGRNMEVTSLYVMATAAMRDAKDGQEFARYLERTYEIDVDIISGEKEAKLGAYGVCSSMYRPRGISGDLGGGSLELVKLEDGQLEDHNSLPLGSLRMVDESNADREKLKKIIDKRFKELRWLADNPSDNFYAIGGSFRALASMYMTHTNYPLRILHQYTVDTKDFQKFVRDIAEMPTDKLEKFPGAAAKRVAALPGAALVLDRIIDMATIRNVVFSASGIREGYLYEKLSPYVRSQDGLLSSCTEFASHGGRSTAYSNELYTWMYPLLTQEDENLRRLRLAFCLLSDIALHIHPEYRAQWSFHRMLYSALTGLSHRERVMLALALYHRYQFKLKEQWPVLSLLSETDKSWSKLVGSAANLAYHLTGTVAGNLHNTAFSVNGSEVGLKLNGNMQDLMGDAVQKRINGVGEAYAEYISRQETV